MNAPADLLAHFDLLEDHPFVSTLVARKAIDFVGLKAVLKRHQAFIKSRVDTRGVVLFRGIDDTNVKAFEPTMVEGLNVESWNGFNLKGLPGAFSNWLRRYTEGLMGSGDYRRFVTANTVQLGPVAHAVQGPHVEGGGSPKRARYLALCCFQPGDFQAETGLADLSQLMRELPVGLRDKYTRAYNNLYYITARKLNVLDRFLLSQSPVTLHEMLPDGRARLGSPRTPAVCMHPVTGDACLQPWAFARNTNGAALEAATQTFSDRPGLSRCPNAEGTHYLWGLYAQNDKALPWDEAEQRALFAHIYQSSTLMAWQRGDIAIIDNIRMAHWRMNGVQGQRKLVQVQLGNFDANDFAPSELLGGLTLEPSHASMKKAA